MSRDEQLEPPQEIVSLDWDIHPEAAISGPVLVQSDKSVLLMFNAMRPRPDGRVDEAGVALVEFVGGYITRFGYPNDEAWGGIPETRGLTYGAYEVRNSRWKRTLVSLNRHSFPQTNDFGGRHF